MTILAEARKLDYDGTLAAVRAKAPEALFALLAFNGELEAIRRKTSDPIIFEMRLLWWREAIADFENRKVRKHPIAEALARAVMRNELDEGLLDVMIARKFAEFREPEKDFKTFLKTRAFDLETLYMNCFLALRGEEEEADFAAFRAFDAVRIWRALPFFEALGLTPFKGKPEAKGVATLLSAGEGAGTRYFKNLNTLAGWHFKRLEKAGFKPENLKPDRHHPGKFFALWRT